jgi:hypothetical protein
MNCKEAGIKLCWACEEGTDECWIPQNEFFFREVLKHRGSLKPQLIADIKVNLSHIHIAAALKLYYPEYYDWFQKMLLLK